MKVIYWNCSKKSHPLTGLKRYEEELFSKTAKRYSDIKLKRICRPDNPLLGNTVLSWLTAYKAEAADIVHATCQTIAPAILFNRPQVFLLTILDIIPLIYPSAQTDLSVKIQWKIIPRAIKRINNFITISEFTKQEIIRLLDVPEDHISTVYLGVDHSKYFPRTNKITCKEHFHLNPDEKHILVVASNLQHKRMDLAAEIIKEIRTRKTDIKMIKIGYGEELKGEGIINLGRISEEDMPILYNAANVFLHTSEYEGFGFPILEAMACGLPVVASNKASIPEIVQNTGNLVDISKTDCIDRFVYAILDNIDNDVDNLAVIQSKKFTWENTVDETMKIYQKLI
jgi:glycosyltransferase involved in cell wall biosynthesis